MNLTAYLTVSLWAEQQLGALLSKINDHYFTDTQTLRVFSSSFDYAYDIDGLLTKASNPREIMNGIAEIRGRRLNGPALSIVQFCSLAQLRYFFSLILVDQRSDRFILICKCERTELSDVVQTVWVNYYLTDFLMVTPQLDVVSWSAFGEGHCGDDFGVVAFPFPPLFPSKKAKRFNGCAVSVKFQYIPPFVIAVDSGVQIEIIQIIGAKYNFTPVYRIHNESATVINFEYMFEGLKDGSDDLTLPLDRLTNARHLLYDYTGYYLEDPDCMCVRTPRKISKLSKLGEIIFSQFYYTIYGLMLHVAVTFGCSVVLGGKERFGTFCGIFNDYLRVILGAGATALPARVTLRILYAAWLLYALVFSTQYTSILFQNFKEPVYELEQFKERLQGATKFVPIYFDRNIMQHLKANATHLADMFQICEDPVECSARVINEGIHMSFMKSLVVDYNVYRFVDEERTILLDCYKNSNSMNYMMMYMRRNHYLKERLAEAVGLIAASGIVRSRLAQLIHANKMRDAVAWETIAVKTDSTGALHFEDFVIICLYILIALALATVVFALELIYFRYGKGIGRRLRMTRARLSRNLQLAT